MTIFIIFLFGLIAGSFLNAVIHRLAAGQSFFEKHSRCPKCGHKLAWQDLVPLGSFFVLGGRCRYCRKPISWQYPAVELVTAVAFVLVYITNVIPAKAGIQFWIPGSSPRTTDYMEIFFQLIFVCFLIIIFVYDLKHYLILDKVVFPAVILAAIFQLSQGHFWEGLLSAVILSGFFGILYAVSRARWIGAGDIKLGLFLGLLAPFPQTLIVFFLAYTSGAAVSALLLLLSKKKMSDRLPFGTFLTAAAYVTMVWGEKLVSWYFQRIGVSL